MTAAGGAAQCRELTGGARDVDALAAGQVHQVQLPHAHRLPHLPRRAAGARLPPDACGMRISSARAYRFVTLPRSDLARAEVSEPGFATHRWQQTVREGLCFAEQDSIRLHSPGCRPSNSAIWAPFAAASDTVVAVLFSTMMMNTAWLRLLSSLSFVAPVARCNAPRSISPYTWQCA